MALQGSQRVEASAGVRRPAIFASPCTQRDGANFPCDLSANQPNIKLPTATFHVGALLSQILKREYLNQDCLNSIKERSSTPHATNSSTENDSRPHLLSSLLFIVGAN